MRHREEEGEEEEEKLEGSNSKEIKLPACQMDWQLAKGTERNKIKFQGSCETQCSGSQPPQKRWRGLALPSSC